MTITNMQQPMQMQPGLGSLRDPRQRYGLGSFVKKAVRGVKKIAKSPIGKMALMYAGTAGLGALAGGAGGTGFGGAMFRPSNIMSNFGSLGRFLPGASSGASLKGKGMGGFFNKMLNPWQSGKFSGKHAFGLGAAALTAAPLFMGGKDDAEDVAESVVQLDPSATVQSAKNYYSNLGDKGVGLNFMPKKKYVSQNFYAADGGRANYANGQLVGPSGDGSRPGYKGEEKMVTIMTEDGIKLIPESEYYNKLNNPLDMPTIIEMMKNSNDNNMIIDVGKRNLGEEYRAHGGRIGYAGGEIVEDEEEVTRTNAGQPFKMRQTFLQMGGGAGEAQAEQMLMAEYIKYKNKGGDLSFQEFVQAVMQQEQEAQGMQQTAMAANGGRIGYAGGQLVSPSADGSRPGYAGPLDFFKNLKSGFGQIFSGETAAVLGGDQEKINEFMAKDMWGVEGDADQETIQMIINMNKQGVDAPTISSITGADTKTVNEIMSILNMKADGGRIGAQEGGIMNTDEASEMIDMGGQEKDYRETGGFVELGGEERADDVPARLSKNEFVFTADAVRAAGGGDIDQGSEVMQNMMDNLEQGGQISEDSQGLGGEEMMSEEEIIEEPNGAQAMYDQQQALQSRMI